MSIQPHQPIGIFDSGIGGLTVVSALTRLLPDETIRFFGDTAHLPYGDKSAEAIRGYTQRITQLLLDEGCKLILIACNSASAAAYQWLTRAHGGRVHFINVIDPVVDYIAAKNYKRIGIIGTKRTIASRAHVGRLKRRSPELLVSTLATPLLAPMIEEGFYNNNISQTIIDSYLSQRSMAGIQALVLACTHYPLIEEQVSNFYKGKVDIISATDVVAESVRDVLAQNRLLALPKPDGPEHHFYVSDYTPSFSRTTQQFFGKRIKLQHRDIWKSES